MEPTLMVFKNSNTDIAVRCGENDTWMEYKYNEQPRPGA